MRVQRKGEIEHFVKRRYGDFARLQKRLRTELPGRVLPPLPKKNKTDTSASAGLLSPRLPDDEIISEDSSVSSQSAAQANGVVAKSMQNLKVVDHRRNKSATSIRSFRSARSARSDRVSPRPSMDTLATSLPSSPKSEVSFLDRECRGRY